jgi:hypothetical protein
MTKRKSTNSDLQSITQKSLLLWFTASEYLLGIFWSLYCLSLLLWFTASEYLLGIFWSLYCLSLLRWFTASDYLFGIFKLYCYDLYLFCTFSHEILSLIRPYCRNCKNPFNLIFSYIDRFQFVYPSFVDLRLLIISLVSSNFIVMICDVCNITDYSFITL